MEWRMTMRVALLPLFLLVVTTVHAGKLEKAFKALEVHDYFKARELFRKEVKKHPAAAWYGLSVISGRANNPFFNLDSAYQFVLKADQAFTAAPDKERVYIGALGVSHTSITAQRDHVFERAWEVVRGQNTVQAYQAYSDRYPSGPRAEEARSVMHHLAFQEARQANTAAAYRAFVEKFPEAREVYEARTLLLGAVFEEATATKDLASYKAFITAATCRQQGHEVTVVEALPVPMERIVGTDLGSLSADLHRDHGVQVRLGVGVEALEGGDRVERPRLSDGALVDSDVVVVGIGVTPDTGWLEGSGLALDNGVVCDETLLAAPGVVAAGDIARWPNVRFGEVMRVEHWENALDQGAHAARLLAGDGPAERFEPVPWFWSDQYDRKIQLAGRSGPNDEVRIVHGTVEERRFVALFGRGGRVVGVLGVNRPRHVMQWRRRIIDAMTWEDGLALAAEEEAAAG